MIDLTPLIEAIIALVAVIITAYVIPMLKKKMSAEEYELLMKIAEQGVLAAEQIMSGSKLGKEKKEYVINCISHEREDLRSEVNSCVVTMVLETRNTEHVNQIKELLVSNGYEIL